MRPPRRMNAALDARCSPITGAVPNRPPNSTLSPTLQPTAGMTHEDVQRISALVKKVAANRTVLMVEHNLSVVANLSHTITVLQRGEILAEGDYATVSKKPEVIQAYMGSGHG